MGTDSHAQIYKYMYMCMYVNIYVLFFKKDKPKLSNVVIHKKRQG